MSNGNNYTKDELIDLLRTYIVNNGVPKSKRKTFRNKNGLPSYETYVSNFGNDLINLVNLCGFALNEEEKYNLNTRGRKNTLSRQEVTKIIYNMQDKIHKPLMYDDFRNPKEDEIGINQIRKYWGSVNKMKEELGLEVIQESMIDRQLNIAEAKQHLNKLCNDIYNKENRKIITYKDINRCNFTNNPWCYNKIFLKELGMTLREFIQNIGFDLAQEGNGLNHLFDDGEKTTSQYELDFSIYLREAIGLKYNIDYLRDIKYKTFVSEYKGLMNCDYVITYKDRVIYIEIAGMLRDNQKHYYNDIPINSKSKEKYRLKLKEKENMFTQSGLEYYILFPCDLNENTYRKIFN